MTLLQTISTRWNQYINASTNRQIAISASLTSVTSLAAKVTSFGKEIVVAAFFGVSGEIDTYVMAFMLIGVPSGIVLGALQTALIPAIIQSDTNKGSRSAESLFKGTTSLALLLMSVLLVILIATVPSIIDFVGHGFTQEKKEQVNELLFWFIPYYFFAGLNLLGYGVLQARKLFFSNGVLPALVAIPTIVLLFIVQTEAGVLVLVWGLALGAGVEYLALNFYLKRRTGFRVTPGRLVLNSETRQMLWQFLIIVPGTLAMAFLPIIDQTLVSDLGEGAIAALSYGIKLPAMVNGLLVTAIGVAVLPFFSQMLAKGDSRACRHTLKRFVSLLLVVSLPAALVLIALSDVLVTSIFQRGAFDGAAKEAVVPIQQAYFLQLPGMLVGMLATRLHVALGQNHTLLLVTIVTVLFYAVAAWALVSWLGTTGVALAASITSAINAVVVVYLADRYLVHKMVLARQSINNL